MPKSAVGHGPMRRSKQLTNGWRSDRPPPPGDWRVTAPHFPVERYDRALDCVVVEFEAAIDSAQRTEHRMTVIVTGAVVVTVIISRVLQSQVSTRHDPPGWAPSLAGKQDLIPGRPNELTIRVHRPGVYRDNTLWAARQSLDAETSPRGWSTTPADRLRIGSRIPKR